VLKEATHQAVDGEAIEGETASPVPVPVVEKAYDKSTSFFDSISCEALDRRKDDADGATARSERRRHERTIDAETFGRAANDRKLYHHHRGGPRRYGNPGSHQSHAASSGNSVPTANMDTRPTRGGGGGYRGGYAAARGSISAQKKFVPVNQKEGAPGN